MWVWQTWDDPIWNWYANTFEKLWSKSSDGWMYYKFFDRERLTWQEAEAYCQSVGGYGWHLWIIRNKWQYTKIQELIQNSNELTEDDSVTN